MSAGVGVACEMAVMVARPGGHAHAAARVLGTHTTILDRASYGATDSLLGDGGISMRDAVEAAAKQGHDGILFLMVTPKVDARGFGASSGFHLAFDLSVALRSLRNDALLLDFTEHYVCHEPALDGGGQFTGWTWREAEQVPQALSECYEPVIASLPALLESHLVR